MDIYTDASSFGDRGRDHRMVMQQAIKCCSICDGSWICSAGQRCVRWLPSSCGLQAYTVVVAPELSNNLFWFIRFNTIYVEQCEELKDLSHQSKVLHSTWLLRMVSSHSRRFGQIGTPNTFLLAQWKSLCSNIIKFVHE